MEEIIQELRRAAAERGEEWLQERVQQLLREEAEVPAVPLPVASQPRRARPPARPSPDMASPQAQHRKRSPTRDPSRRGTADTVPPCTPGRGRNPKIRRSPPAGRTRSARRSTRRLDSGPGTAAPAQGSVAGGPLHEKDGGLYGAAAGEGTASPAAGASPASEDGRIRGHLAEEDSRRPGRQDSGSAAGGVTAPTQPVGPFSSASSGRVGGGGGMSSLAVEHSGVAVAGLIRSSLAPGSVSDYITMADTEPKKTRKRHHPCPELPAKRCHIDPPQSSFQRRHVPYSPPNELLRCLGLFLHQRCPKLNLSATQPIKWLKNIDIYLLIAGYQRVSFLSSGSVVFLYMLCRDLISPEMDSMEQFKMSLFTCYYISHSYIGNELGYPLKPFLVDGSKLAFWDQCLSYIRIMSSKMLCINNNGQFYKAMLAELKAVGR
ncbi:cyclin-dependent kinase 5 activator 2-like [Bufo bufo]|uniref:cyclin-dependent kinase 5 activator 2-like n=1 Tax=Bufo bufo TaxID=8384 RepID=UPI001ABE28B9|nr:cyclin-dependent kinase 5 activator 2-like [Bufo bufo]